MGGREDEKVSGDASEPDLLPVFAFLSKRLEALYQLLQAAESHPERRIRLDKLMSMVLELLDACKPQGDGQDELREPSGVPPEARGPLQADSDEEWESRLESVQRSVRSASQPEARRRRRGGGRRR